MGSLSRFPFHWPVLDATFIAAAMRWATIFVILAGVMWFFSGLFRPKADKTSPGRPHEMGLDTRSGRPWHIVLRTTACSRARLGKINPYRAATARERLLPRPLMQTKNAAVVPSPGICACRAAALPFERHGAQRSR